ncbi:hypothetical protein ACJX0J_008930, partial [Zea mays]
DNYSNAKMKIYKKGFTQNMLANLKTMLSSLAMFMLFFWQGEDGMWQNLLQKIPKEIAIATAWKTTGDSRSIVSILEGTPRKGKRMANVLDVAGVLLRVRRILLEKEKEGLVEALSIYFRYYSRISSTIVSFPHISVIFFVKTGVKLKCSTCIFHGDVGWGMPKIKDEGKKLELRFEEEAGGVKKKMVIKKLEGLSKELDQV